ncbi:MAG: polyprenyl synthetase family protein [Chloroflexota bacterium]
MATEPLLDYLHSQRAVIDHFLDRYLPSAEEEPRVIHECMRYATRDGKRLRPIITLAVADALGCPAQQVIATGVAIELIHTHSLILDDMPCMDDDDFRRGRPTCHKAFGEAIALLAADALLNLAITILASNHRLANVSPETALEIIRTVGETVGPNGVIGGQVADLSFPPAAHWNGGIGKLQQIHLNKTARLFTLSARVAALVAGASLVESEAVCRYATNLGLAFQIVDDVLDEVPGHTLSTRGGTVEPNYAAAVGVEEARSLARAATEEAIGALASLPRAADVLRTLARYNLTRHH